MIYGTSLYVSDQEICYLFIYLKKNGTRILKLVLSETQFKDFVNAICYSVSTKAPTIHIDTRTHTQVQN